MKFTLCACLFIAGAVAAEDIETLKHEVFKNVTVSRVEPDGVVITHSAGIVKIPFAELSEQYQKRFSYDPIKAQEFAEQDAQTQRQIYEQNEAAKKGMLEKRAEIAKLNAIDIEVARAKKQLAAEKQRTAQMRRNAIANHEVFVGMTRAELTESLDIPNHINATIVEGLTREQWCYPTSYVYLDNGVVVAVQLRW